MKWKFLPLSVVLCMLTAMLPLLGGMTVVGLGEETIEQNTFENWELPGTGTTKDFTVAANGRYSWNASYPLSLDTANNGAVQNTSLLVDGTAAPTYLAIELTQVPSVDYTLSFDFVGTVQDYYITGNMQLIRYNDIKKQPLRIGTDGVFEVNGVDMSLSYTPNHWYRADMHVSFSASSGTSAKVTVALTDITTEAVESKSFTMKDAANGKQIQIQTLAGFGPLYIDNVDIYEGMLDDARLATPTLLPGTEPTVEDTYTVTAVSANKEQGTAAVTTAGDTFTKGTAVTVEATPNGNFQFKCWKAEGIILTAEQQLQNPLTFAMPSNNVTITAEFEAKQDAVITPKTASYDKYDGSGQHRDIAVTLQPGDYVFSALKYGETVLKKDTDYTVSDGIYTIRSSYLDTLPIGNAVVTFDMDGGQDPILAITIINSTPGIQTYMVIASADSTKGYAEVTTPGETFEAGVNVTVEATAQEGYQFTGWIAEGITLATGQQSQNPLTFTMPQNNVTITAMFEVDETPDAIEQNTFENWALPETGKTQDFVVAENGSYTWGSNLSLVDAYVWENVNTSLLLDGTNANTYLNINFNDALDYGEGYTVAFDFVGTETEYEISTNPGYMVLIQFPTIGRRPFEIDSSGTFEYNAADMDMKYTPNHWYHVEMQVAKASSGGISVTTITLTDTTTNETVSNTFNLNGNPQTEKQIRINATAGFGKLYIDNLDIYEGAPDSTRLTTPTMLPGTQIGQQPGADYYIGAAHAATAGITITKNAVSADDHAVIVTALYDNSTGAPSLAAVTSREAILKTGETISLAADEIVQKPREGNWSVRYFIWEIGGDGNTLDVLAAIDAG